jgi:F5/8 type C domain/Carbohydrate binding module (family 6)/Abnormal spindle-like microcephaly-assoc'd, ASPM-SPD-2-Hydin
MREDHSESAGGAVTAADEGPNGGRSTWWVRDGDVLVAVGAGAVPGWLGGLAVGLEGDRRHVMVVAGGELSPQEWARVADGLADVLGRSSRGVRLVPGDAGAGSLVGAGAWLAGRLGRTVLVPDGVVARASAGGLFVAAGDGPGWVRVRPGERAVAGSRRFPVPAWACEALERVSVLSDGAVAEPLPGGAWIRPPAGAVVAGYRRWLVSRLAWRDDRVYVVLGHPGAIPVAAADVVTFWGLLPEGVRGLVRFVPYGPVAGEGAAGQVLAGWLGVPVGVVAGVPLGGLVPGAGARVRAVRADGSTGWEPFAREVLYCPAGPDARVPEPRVLACRPPVAGLAEAGPGVYECGPGIVAEVVQGGVWLRPAGPAPGATVARVREAEADEPLVFVDEALEAAGREPAVTGLLNALEPAVRASLRLVPVPSLSEAAQPANEPLAAPAIPSPAVPESVAPVPIPAPAPAVPESVAPVPIAAPAHVPDPVLPQSLGVPAIRLESGIDLGPDPDPDAYAQPGGVWHGGARADQESEVEFDAFAGLASAVHRATGDTETADEAVAAGALPAAGGGRAGAGDGFPRPNPALRLSAAALARMRKGVAGTTDWVSRPRSLRIRGRRIRVTRRAGGVVAVALTCLIVALSAPLWVRHTGAGTHAPQAPEPQTPTASRPRPVASSASGREGPYGGTAAAVPGTVQAANYDTGGQGVAYNVAAAHGAGSTYRPNGVDLQACSDTGCDLGWTMAGQWFKYTVDVAAAGAYTVGFQLASPSGVIDGLHIASSSGKNLSGAVNVPDTGGSQAWATTTAAVTLPAGRQTLTVDQDNGGWSIRSLTFTAPAHPHPHQAPASALAASLPSLSFGSQATATTSGVHIVTVSNRNATAVAISRLAVSGPFSQANNCGPAIPANGSCVISVKFRPATTGPATGTLTVVSDALGSPLIVALSGKGVSASATNLALNQPITGSTAFGTYVWSNADDGNTSTYWESQDGTGWPQSLTVDLGSVRTIGSITLDLPPLSDWNTRTETLSVLGSSDDTTFTQIVGSAGYTFNVATGNTVTISLPAGTSTRYVRLNFTANTGWDAAQVSEFQVFP